MVKVKMYSLTYISIIEEYPVRGIAPPNMALNELHK